MGRQGLLANHSRLLKLVSAAFIHKRQPVTLTPDTPPYWQRQPLSLVLSFSLVLLFIYCVAYKDGSMFSFAIPTASSSHQKIRECSVP